MQPNNPPVITGFTANQLSAPAGSTFTFTITASDPDANALTYFIDLADGQGFRNNGASSSISAQFTVPGSYTIRAKVNDGRVDSQQATLAITVTGQGQNRAPVITSLTAVPQSGPTGTVHAITAIASDPDGNALAYFFDLGDGQGFRNLGGFNTIAAQYTTAGPKTIRAKVNDGAVDSATSSITITAIAAPVPSPQPPSTITREINPRKQIYWGGVRLLNDGIASPGESLQVWSKLTNHGETDLKSPSLKVVIPELGVFSSTGFDRVDSDDTVSAMVEVPVPDDALPGEYLARISLGNGDSRRVKHKILIVE